MRDSVESTFVQPSTVAQAIASVLRIERWRSRGAVVVISAAVAAVLICSLQAAVAGRNTTRAAGFGYLCFTLVNLGCAWSFWSRARFAKGTLYIRGALISVAALAAAIGYAPSFTQYIFNTPPQRVLQTICFNSGEALYMLAGVLFFAGVTRSVVIVDTLQALLFFVLRFNLVYSPVNRDHFTTNHLLIGELMALFLFLVAMVGCLGAASRAEVRFLRTLAWFFGLRSIQFFLSNQVSYKWLHYTNCSLWDVPGTVLLAAFSLYMLYSSPSANNEAAADEPLTHSLLVGSLMPSFLALVNLMLSLFLLRTSLPLAATAISLTLVCYMVRTGLLHAQVMTDKALLQIRNEQLEGLAIRDPLTGIGNRRSLAETYTRLQTFAGYEKLSLLVIDIDYLKQANDIHGHMHGDEVLIALARQLESLAAGVPAGHCARLGGDEFALLLPDVTPHTAFTMADELRAIFSSHEFKTEKNAVSLSIGVASLQAAHDMPLETLVCSADKALYRAKQLGRDRVEVQPVWGARDSGRPRYAKGASEIPAHR